MAKLKACFLIPAGFTGAFTVLALSIPPRTTADILLPIAILVPCYLAIAAIVARMWTSPGERRYLGHTRKTWTFLITLAYGVGMVSALLS